jgi:putative tricarboxylic transport membrane protein
MLIARGDISVFFTRPISGGLLLLSAVLLVLAALPMIRQKREVLVVE